MPTYAIILMVIGIALIILEIFLPSGGILGFMAAVALLASLVLAFRESDATGFTFLGICLVVVPVAVILGLKFFLPLAVLNRLSKIAILVILASGNSQLS